LVSERKKQNALAVLFVTIGTILSAVSIALGYNLIKLFKEKP